MSSTSALPSVTAACLEAINNKNLDDFVHTFDQNAIVIDEGKTHNGRPEISAWCAEALISHKASVEIKNVTDLTGHVVVKVIMDGDFIADYGITEPFPLYFDFVLSDLVIKYLAVTPWDSTKPSMNAVYADKANLEDPISSIKVSKRPQQEPPEGWVKVKMQAVGLNYHDIFSLRGLGMHPLTFPLILGCEGAGTLEDGTPVLLYPAMGDSNFKDDETLDPKRHVISELTAGTLAQYVIVPRRNAVERPAQLDINSASVLGIAWLTAYRMLFTKSGLRAGQTMLVQGSSGGVTTALIQMGAAAGMRVWCTGRTADKRELGLKLGAEKAFVAGEGLPGKVDVVFDTSGEASWAHSMNSLKPGGAIVTCGGHAGRSIPTDVGNVFINQLSIRGSYLGTLQEFKDLIAFVVAKGIKPHIGLVLPMEKTDVGFQKMLAGETEGKIVITIPS